MLRFVPTLSFLSTLLLLLRYCDCTENDRSLELKTSPGLPSNSQLLSVPLVHHLQKRQLFRWDDVNQPSPETTTIRGGKKKKKPKGKKTKKGIKKRSKNERDNIWWPWASYEDWLRRHEPQTNSNAISNDEPPRKSTEKREEKLDKKKRLMKEKKIKESKEKHQKKPNKELPVKQSNETSLERSRTLFFVQPDILLEHSNSNNLHDKKGFHHDPFFKPQKKNFQYLKRKSISSEDMDLDNEIRKFYDQVPSWKKSILKASRRNFTSDENECFENNGGCEGLCINTPGSYYCHCPPGFKLDSSRKKCIDVNECLLRNGRGPCEGECENTWGGYKCSCANLPGTELSEDEHSCLAVDRCGNAQCSHICLKTQTGPFCACPPGYALAHDWKTCHDVDECLQPSLQVLPCHGRCVNTPGSYSCL